MIFSHFSFWFHAILFWLYINLNPLHSHSARSRVRGTLEVYHAFIRDADTSDTSSSTNLEQDWEVVNNRDTDTDSDSVNQSISCHSQINWQLI